ncbi:MAG TPA: DUF4159 domain-containing protein [Steroidobacteraceae bacterium]|jgi:hypothetical protein|nr:DUF4159 domain-containing protein [Steroidobacteraceae bacterium]
MLTRLRPALLTLALAAPLACAALLGDSGIASPTRSTSSSEFHFARMIYTDSPQFRGFGRGWWQQDWPTAETHFLESVRRLTRVNSGDPVTLRVTDDALFDYPWLYATQVGYWELSDEEIARLREYLLRGGFLMADDYWGEDERAVFEATMLRVFPDRPIVEIQRGDAVLHVPFTIDEFTQIPGLRHVRGFMNLDQLPPPRWRGIYDDNGRLMVAMNYNQDVGDSWEEADTPDYPEPMTALGYRFGINYIVYAMTH